MAPTVRSQDYSIVSDCLSRPERTRRQALSAEEGAKSASLFVDRNGVVEDQATTVRIDRLPCNMGRVIACQERGDGGDFRGFAAAPHRRPGQGGMAPLGGRENCSRHHFRQDRPGPDADDPNTMRRKRDGAIVVSWFMPPLEMA